MGALGIGADRDQAGGDPDHAASLRFVEAEDLRAGDELVLDDPEQRPADQFVRALRLVAGADRRLAGLSPTIEALGEHVEAGAAERDLGDVEWMHGGDVGAAKRGSSRAETPQGR